ncbi:MAG: hypothetical protein HY859_18050, partial [Caulobacterales bacterium]|nr:hypothetical protein [Caulobacterales bacterium]
TTMVSALGVEGARAALRDHLEAARAALAEAGAGTGPLAPYVMALFEARKVAA